MLKLASAFPLATLLLRCPSMSNPSARRRAISGLLAIGPGMGMIIFGSPALGCLLRNPVFYGRRPIGVGAELCLFSMRVIGAPGLVFTAAEITAIAISCPAIKAAAWTTTAFTTTTR